MGDGDAKKENANIYVMKIDKGDDTDESSSKCYFQNFTCVKSNKHRSAVNFLCCHS